MLDAVDRADGLLGTVGQLPVMPEAGVLVTHKVEGIPCRVGLLGNGQVTTVLIGQLNDLILLLRIDINREHLSHLHLGV